MPNPLRRDQTSRMSQLRRSHRRSFLRTLRTVILAVACGLNSGLESRLRGDQLGRTAASGDWSDGNWKNSSGLNATPSSSDNVFIGVELPSIDWLGDTSVSLTGNATVANVTLGDDNKWGSIDISGILSTGTLSLNKGSTLNLSGTLNANHLELRGSDATLGGTISTLSNGFQFNDSIVNINSSLFCNSTSSIHGGITNVNVSLDMNSNQLYVNGGTLNQNADISAGLLIIGNAALIRLSGNLNLSSLWVNYSSSASLSAGDLVQYVDVDAGSDLSLNANVNVGTQIDLRGALNLNGYRLTTGTLSMDSATLNRGASGSFVTDNLDLSNSIYALDGTDTVNRSLSTRTTKLVIETPTTLASGFQFRDSIVDINSKLSSSSTSFINGGTTSVNATLESSSSFWVDGAYLDQNADIISGEQLVLGRYGNASTLNRISGNLILRSLSIDYGSITSLTANDAVQYVSIGATSELSLTANVTVGAEMGVWGTINLNGNQLTTGNLVVDGNSGVLNRGSGGSFVTDNLDLRDWAYTIDGTDTINNYLSASNSTLAIETPTTLSDGFQFRDSIVGINSNLYCGNSSDINGGTTIVSATLSLNGQVLNVDGGIINQNADISAGHLWLGKYGNPSTLNRISGDLSVGTLWLTNGSVLTYDQQLGESTGFSLDSLILDASSHLRVNFDSLYAGGFDWGFRLAGDQHLFLDSLLSSGQLVSNNSSAIVLYDFDHYGGFTYFGIVAVPEPSSALLVGSMLVMSLGFSRFRSNARLHMDSSSP